MCKILPTNKDDLYKEYSKFGSIKALAKKYDVPDWFVRFELGYFGIIEYTDWNLSDNKPDIDLEVLRSGMRVHRSVSKLADSLGEPYTVVRESLRVAGIFPKAWSRSVINWTEKELRKDLEEHNNIDAIAKKHNCHRSTVLNAMKKFDISMPDEMIPSKCKGKKYNFTYAQLEKDYEELQSLAAISRKYDCSLYTIWTAMNELGVPYKGHKDE